MAQKSHRIFFVHNGTEYVKEMSVINEINLLANFKSVGMCVLFT